MFIAPSADGIRVQPGRRHGDLFDGVEAFRREGIEAGAAALEALRVIVHAIERNVQRRVGQAVERAAARGRLRALAVSSEKFSASRLV